MRIHTETAPFNELATRINGLPVEPRCRVCRNDEVRQKVNDLLSGGASYAMILRALEQDNAKLDTARAGHDRFDPPPHQAALPGAERREGHLPRILERRAQENGVDFVKGVATAITPMAFFETVMVKGYETLVDSDTKVDVSTGMIAAGSAASADRIPGQRNPHRRPHGARWVASSTPSTPRVPEELWPEILRKIDGPVAADTPADEIEDCDDAEDEYDPMESAEADEDCWTATARRDSPVEGRRAPTRAIEAPSPAMREFTPKTVKDDDDF